MATLFITQPPFINSYGKTTWRFENSDGVTQFFNPSQDSNEEKAAAKNKEKGFYIGTAKLPGYVDTVGGGGRGLSGATSVQYAILARRKNLEPSDIEIIDNGQGN